MSGKVVVNRSMSLDGFIAGPGHAMDWVFDFVAPDEFAEIAAATGAMLVGRRTWEVGDRMEAEEPGSVDYPFSGPMFLLTHRPLEPPDPEVTILTGDIGEAVATALDAAGGKNLEILGADVAGQCLQRGLVDEILVYVLPVLLGDGIRFSSPGLARIDLEPLSSTRSGAVTLLRFRVRSSHRCSDCGQACAPRPAALASSRLVCELPHQAPRLVIADSEVRQLKTAPRFVALIRGLELPTRSGGDVISTRS